MSSVLGWRFTGYWSLFMGGISFVLILFFLPETYAPVVLIQKASELRRRTHNWGIHAKQEEVEVDVRELLTKNFTRPIRMLITEPVLMLVSFYMAFIYALLYLFLTAYPLVSWRVPFLCLIASNECPGLPRCLRHESRCRRSPILRHGNRNCSRSSHDRLHRTWLQSKAGGQWRNTCG